MAGIKLAAPFHVRIGACMSHATTAHHQAKKLFEEADKTNSPAWHDLEDAVDRLDAAVSSLENAMRRAKEGR